MLSRGSCRLQTQRVPLARLSLVTMEGTSFGARYREAMEALTQALTPVDLSTPLNARKAPLESI